MKKAGSLLCSVLMFVPAYAEPEVGKHVASNMDALTMILSLLMVLGLIVISALVLKKFNLTAYQTDGLKVISSLPLGTKEKLVVVQVGDKQLLLGVTSQQINLLESLDQPLDIKAPVNQQLASSLQKFLKKQS